MRHELVGIDLAEARLVPGIAPSEAGRATAAEPVTAERAPTPNSEPPVLRRSHARVLLLLLRTRSIQLRFQVRRNIVRTCAG
jgi:hypothetical protein